MVIVYKKVLLSGIDPLILNLFVFGFTFIGFIAWSTVANVEININLSIVALLVLASIFALFGNFFDAQAIKSAPNPGFAATLKAGQIVVITLLAPVLFGSSLSLLSFLGVVFVFVGIIIISMY